MKSIIPLLLIFIGGLLTVLLYTLVSPLFSLIGAFIALCGIFALLYEDNPLESNYVAYVNEVACHLKCMGLNQHEIDYCIGLIWDDDFRYYEPEQAAKHLYNFLKRIKS